MTAAASDPQDRHHTGSGKQGAAGIPSGSPTPGTPPQQPPGREAGSWSQRITTAILLVAMLGLLVEAGIWAWDRLATYGPGDRFPSVETVSLDRGSPNTWVPATGGDEPATLLLLFTTTCAVCQANVRSWNMLFDGVSSDVRVAGLSLDPVDRTRRFVDTLGVRFPVEVVTQPEAFMEGISLPGVPLTLILDVDGELVEYWYGPLNSQLRRAIEERLAEFAPELSSSRSFEPTASRRPHVSPRPDGTFPDRDAPGTVHVTNRVRQGGGGLDLASTTSPRRWSVPFAGSWSQPRTP